MVFHYVVIFLSDCMDSAPEVKTCCLSRTVLHLIAGFGGIAVAEGDISCLVFQKWLGDRMAIFGLLQFWPIFDFYLFSIP